MMPQDENVEYDIAYSKMSILYLKSLVLLAFSLIYFCNLIIFLQGANDYLIGRNNANEIDLNR